MCAYIVSIKLDNGHDIVLVDIDFLLLSAVLLKNMEW